MMRLRSIPALAVLLTLLGACSDSGVTADLTTVTVDTAVDTHFLNAGAQFKVSCLVLDSEGREVKTETAFTVIPGKAVVVSGSKVTPNLPGEYVVTCMLPDGSRPDETPETVIVTKKNIATVETKLDRNNVLAGEDVHAECTVLNKNGETVDWPTELVIDPPGGHEIDGLTIHAKTLGTFLVACRATDLPIVDTTPETLEVGSGDPALVRATIKEEEVVAGTQVQVFCTVEDSYGNVLEIPATPDAQEGIEVEGGTIIPVKAGEYDVTCSAEGEHAELEQVPDHLLVTAGPVASVLLTPKPKKNAYKIGDKVEIIASAADAFGNPIEGIDVTVTPPEGMKAAGAKYEFISEGAFTFKGTLAPPYEDITGELTLYCDETGPEIVVFTPERGATLDGETVVDVEGNVKDALSLDKVKLLINGKSVPVDEDGNFFHVVEAAHGINLLTFKATDSFGNQEKVVQSFYYSTDYVDFSSGDINQAMLEQSLLVYLGQNFLDDGVHDKQNIDDVATLVEILLDSVSLDMLGGPLPVVDTVVPGLVNMTLFNVAGFDFKLTGDLGLVVYVEQVSMAEPYVGIKTREGGLDMAISFLGNKQDPGVFVQLFVELDFILTVKSTLGGSQLFSAGISPGIAVQTSLGVETLVVETSLDIAKEVGGDLKVKVKNLSVKPAGIHIEPLQDLKLDLGEVSFNGQQVFDLPVVELGQLVSGINDILSSYIIDPVLNFVIPGLLDLLEPIIEQQVTTLLQNLLGQFELEVPLPIPQLPGSDKAVAAKFKTRLSSVEFTAAGGELGLAAGFMATKATDREVLGSILRAGCGSGAFGVPKFDSAEKVEIGAALDMVNELVFSLWWGGGLGLKLDESVLGGISLDQFGLSNLGVATNFWLSPILDDCTAKGMVEVQVGDLELTLSFKLMGAPVKLVLFVSAVMDAKLYGQGNEIGIDIFGVTDFGTQIVSIEGDLGALMGGLDIEQLLEEILVPMILEQVNNLSLGTFPLPEIDLSTLLPGIPPGTTLSLGNLEIKMTKGYLIFNGELM